jgi:hypothetical protein
VKEDGGPRKKTHTQKNIVFKVDVFLLYSVGLLRWWLGVLEGLGSKRGVQGVIADFYSKITRVIISLLNSTINRLIENADSNEENVVAL